VARGAVLVAGLSGLAALMYEVLWTRLLITLIGSSTYAFSLVLVAFITGITAGSFLVGQRWSLKAERVRLLILCQLGIAAGTMLALPLFERLPFLLWKLTLYLPLTDQNFGLFLAVEYCCCVLLMLVPTVLMGMSLPLVVGIVTDVSGGRIGRSVGIVFSVNTLGTVVGAVLAGAVLIPAIGIQQSFSVGIGVNVVAAMVMIAVAMRWRTGWRVVAVVALMVGATFYGVAVPPLDQDILASGIYRKLKETPPGTYQDFLRSLRRRAVVFSSEGAHANVAVMEYLDGSNLRVLTINGKPDASNGQDMPTQMLLGHLPMMLHPNPRSVFVIGLGSGATVGAVLTHSVDSVRCLEIAPEVVDASRYFSDINGNCLDETRLHMTIDDAHTFLRLVPAAYDVIISEPSNPWIAGIGNLFSQEYFAVCRSRLAGGGVMAQWLQTYETDDRIVQLVLNTFQSVFPYTQVWMPTSGDLILLGSDRSLDALPDSLNERFSIPAVRASLRGISIHSIFALLTTQVLTSEATYAVTNGEPINTENNPALEFQAPRTLHARGASSLVEREDERLNGTGEGLLVRMFLAGRDPTQAEVLGALRYHYEQGSAYQITYGLSRYVLDRWGNDYTARLLNIRAQRALGLRVADVRELRGLLRQAPESTQVIHDFVNEEWREIHGASTFLRTYPLRSVAEALTTIAGRDSASVLGLEMRLAELFLRNGEVRAADSICTLMERILDASPRLAAALPPDQFLYITGRIWLLTGKAELCMRAYQRLHEAMPASPLTKELGRRLNWRLQHIKKG
jgi:spermidine synthase